jgi:hypothetical protein
VSATRIAAAASRLCLGFCPFARVALGFDPVAKFGQRFDRVPGVPDAGRSRLRGRLAAQPIGLGLLDGVDGLAHG